MRITSVLLTMTLLMTGLMTGTAVAQDPPDTLNEIKERGALVIGYREDARPFSFKGEDGQPTGYSVDLCRKIADEVKRATGLDALDVRYKAVPSADRIEMVKNGDVDIECGASTHTLERREQVDFTLATFVTGAEMLTAKDSGINDLPGTAGKTIGVLKGTTTEEGLTAALKAASIDADVKSFDSHEQGIEALKANQIQAYFADRILLLGLAQKFPDPTQYQLSGQFYSYEPYAFVVRRGDSNLRLAADRALSEMYRSGEVWKIYSKYFGDANPSELLVALYILNGIPAR